MTTLTRNEFVTRNADKSIDLSQTQGVLAARNQQALRRADLNGDGKIEGSKELGKAFDNLDDFDRNGSRTSINMGSAERPAPLAGTVKAIERTATPRRGLTGGNGGNTGGTTPTAPTTPTTPTTPARGADGVAQITRTTRAGARDQMVEGQVTVNGHTYNFRSGGHGRGSLPKGDYQITRHMDSRNTPGMVVDGVGYSFAMSDKFDSRVGGTRSLLRIHPDGGSAGTQGCMGIVGNADVQRRFREDMLAEIRRNGGSYTLRVQ